MKDIARAFQHFKAVDPELYRVGFPLRAKLSRANKKKNNGELFATLCESVVSQQLSVKASDTIWRRLQKNCGGRVSVSSVLSAPLSKLRKAGLSGAKAKTIKELAKAVQKGLNLKSLHDKTPEEAESALTAVWGIGPWTTEMFLMFALNHPDIFSSRDLGLVRSMETLYELPKNTKREKLEKLAQRWSPYRTYACLILWRVRDALQSRN
jgi:DNA-3-methyladenine glycosylase II